MNDPAGVGEFYQPCNLTSPNLLMAMLSALHVVLRKGVYKTACANNDVDAPISSI